jgi:hypothetical protein
MEKIKETEEEYTLRMLNEALTGKRYPVTPQLLKELKELSKQRRKEKMNDTNT